MDCVTVWGAVEQRLMEKLDTDTFERYLAGIVPLSFDVDKSVLSLGVLNDFVALWLDSNYKEIIAEVIFDTLHQRVQIRFEGGHEKVMPKTAAVHSKPGRSATKVADEGAEYTYRPDFTFDNFVVGNSNRITHAAAMAVCSSPGKAYNPLFIYGGVGLGKTHLLQAIANDITHRRKRAKVLYLTSEEFVNQYVEGMQRKSLSEFRRRLRSSDILIIDDVQFFKGKVGSSEEFFHTFNTLHNTHKQIVLASDRMPKEIDGLEQRLVSRFEWGLSAEILSPDVETRVAILKKKQESHAVKIPDDILFVIANRVRSNIRNLESALTKLIMNVSAFGLELNQATVNDLLRDKFDDESTKHLTIESVQRRVAEFYDIRLADMTSKKRPQNIAMPRMVAMYLARRNTNNSLPVIGDAFSRNHATVIHAINTIERKMAADDGFQRTIDQLMRLIHT